MSLLSRRAEKLCSRLDLTTPHPRPHDKLVFVDDKVSAGAPLLLDTGVYIHQLKGRTPSGLDVLVRARLVNHSVVAVQEMMHALGVLDPADARTKTSASAIRGLVDAIPTHRLFAPTSDVMLDAAVYAGVLCRLRGYAKDQRMKALHDCTLFLQARGLGSTLVTANVGDFDLLQQMQPDGHVLFYRTG